ncbi:hypothetical protein ABEB36_000841 [Hypothenemus hampei]|uniref:PCI domain-containing protein n=1 Tax=Hypothenemus hampei TaxID=57062 RepID=A0ABD1FCL3_HYPHA
MAEDITDVALIPPPPGISPPPLPREDPPPLPPIPPETPAPVDIKQPPPPPLPVTDFVNNQNAWHQNAWAFYMNGAYNFTPPNYQAYYGWGPYYNGKMQDPMPAAEQMNNQNVPPYGNKPIRFQINGKRLPNQNVMSSPNSGAAKKKRKKNRNNQNQQFHNASLGFQFSSPAPPLPPDDIPKPEPSPTVLPPLPPESPSSVPKEDTPMDEMPIQETKFNNGTVNGINNPADDWPQSLKDYVHNCYAKCKTTIDKNQVEIILKGKITQAYQQGQLNKDWSKEPLPSIYSDTQQHPPQQQTNQLSKFSGQPNIKTGILSQFQQGPKKGLSAALGARLGGRNSFRCKGRDSRSRSRSRSPRKVRNRSRSPRKTGKHSSSSSTEEEDFKPVIKPQQKKGKIADRLGPQKGGKITKKQKAKEKKAAFYQTFGQDLEENSEVLQQRAARFGNNVSSKTSISSPGFMLDTNPLLDLTASELDWASMHIKGTCREVEKSFLRLTKAPEACDVRPIEVLRLALTNVKNKWVHKQDYFYACDQLKSIRQDLTVQGIRNEFTVEVYETHARIALEKGDHEEFNQCQTQLKSLYSETGGKNRNEFVGYRILYYIFTKNTLDIMTIMKSLTLAEKADKVVSFALKFRSAWGSGNFHRMFSMYLVAPLMASFLIEWFIDRERKEYLKCVIKR